MVVALVDLQGVAAVFTPRVVLHIALARFLSNGNWRVVHPRKAGTVEMMYEFEQPFIVDSSKFEKTFDMQATPMKEAINETVA